MNRVWRVKKRKFLRDKRGRVIGRPGDTFPEDHADAVASPHAVELVQDPHVAAVEEKIVEDEEPGEIDELDELDPGWSRGL